MLAQEMSLSSVIAAHTEAVSVHIRLLRRRRAVLLAIADRGCTPSAMASISLLAGLSEAERRAVIGEFVDSIFGDRRAESAAEGIARTLTPELPDDPEPEQIRAWVELVELSQDRGFRDVMRMLTEHLAVDRACHGKGVHRDTAAMIRDLVGPAVIAGVVPSSPEAGPVVDAVAADFARVVDRPADEGLRLQLLTWLDAANDGRRQRYLELLSVVNGWPK
ncbi:hypothetical protein [Rhodococcus sp. 24CO]|uniref:hypothetical protein n=1 Tax=Rhodococcus sp. 24CO TaxID=3117460 RepID=UPI003D3424D8